MHRLQQEPCNTIAPPWVITHARTHAHTQCHTSTHVHTNTHTHADARTHTRIHARAHPKNVAAQQPVWPRSGSAPEQGGMAYRQSTPDERSRTPGFGFSSRPFSQQTRMPIDAHDHKHMHYKNTFCQHVEVSNLRGQGRTQKGTWPAPGTAARWFGAPCA